VVLDSGDLFYARNKLAERDADAVKARADLLVAAYEKQGCSALAVGDRDIGALGIDALKELDKKTSFPFLCSNVLDETGKPVFKPYTVVEAAGYKLGVIAVVTGGAEIGAREKYSLRPAVEAAARYVEELEKEKVDAVILLAHLDRRDAQTLMNKVKGIDLVLGGQSMGTSRHLEPIVDGWWAEPGQKGKFLNIITLNMLEGGRKAFVVREEAEKLKQEVRDVDRRIQRYVRLAKGPSRPGTRTQNKSRFKNVIESLLNQRKELAERAKKLAMVAPDAPFLSFESVPLNRKLREDADLAKEVSEFEKAHPKPSRPGHSRVPSSTSGRVSREQLHKAVMAEGVRRGKTRKIDAGKAEAVKARPRKVVAPRKAAPRKVAPAVEPEK